MYFNRVNSQNWQTLNAFEAWNIFKIENIRVEYLWENIEYLWKQCLFTHFMNLVSFYTSWKHVFQGVWKDQWHEMSFNITPVFPFVVTAVEHRNHWDEGNIGEACFNKITCNVYKLGTIGPMRSSAFPLSTHSREFLYPLPLYTSFYQTLQPQSLSTRNKSTQVFANIKRINYYLFPWNIGKVIGFLLVSWGIEGS